MVQGKRNQRNGRSQAHFRSRTTRSTKGKLLTDPAQNTHLLNEQLRCMGLYAAPTVGDGNCLFRALSDQLYGTESRHPQLRKNICDWIEDNKPRYEPFVEDERGLDVHLRCMRENATYGGHLELSAFAHMTRRNVKVIQPGLVYVIEWNAGGGQPPDESLDEREKRRLRRDMKRLEKEKEILNESSGSSVDSNGEHVGTIYVAYHDWEHFSSIRNMRGPHSGLPCVSELASSEVSVLLDRKKSLAKAKSKPIPSRTVPKPEPSDDLLSTPCQIPLPSSRSPSPQIIFPTTSSAPPSTADSATSSEQSHPRISIRIHRSPKRSFDESSGSSCSQSTTTSDAVAKRTRASRARLADTQHQDHMNVDTPEADAADYSTPELSATASTSPSSSSPSPSPPLSHPVHMTRRQRKALGLPKPRPVVRPGAGAGAGKILIPGGRYNRRASSAAAADRVMRDEAEADGEDDDAEWKRNGTGRVDVRGFRELKI